MKYEIASADADSHTRNDNSLTILGFSVGISFLLIAVVMLSGQVAYATYLALMTVIVLVIAFLKALLVANFKVRSPASRAIVGVTLGWLLSGFISAIFDALSSGAEFALLPNAWLLGLAPLVVVYVVGWIIHQRQR
ncbi:hypothetical protein ACFO7V_17875 [Glutamicibacter bergerei]|uniref:Uncharacterized protein n=1 Tax=Glutamicibacter bergerei TaxID=256702 RepID=A0ABV9MTP5_9MICC